MRFKRNTRKPIQKRPCKVCGSLFKPQGNRLPGKYCSLACYFKSRKQRAKDVLKTRLLSKLRVNANGCWEYSGSRATFGYGQISVNNRCARAHRVSWELHNGPIPDDLEVLHRCDNPPCCNPSHLFLGTQADNARDMWAKKRGSAPPRSPKYGEEHVGCKLTNEQVAFIRSPGASGVNNSKLSNLLNVSPSLIWAIRAGRRRAS